MGVHEQMLARVARLPVNRNWYDVRAAGDDKVVVRIYDEIGYWGVTAEDFARELASITASEIEVQINSPGGEVFAGIAIFNALRTHPARVTTRVDGLAASVASVIAQAGDHRVIVQAGQMMIHEAWGVAIGPAADMREFADLLDRQSDVIASIYGERSGGDAAAFRELMRAESWLSDQESLDLGLADELFVPERQQARTPVAPRADVTPPPPPAPPIPDPAPAEVFDASDHLDRDWVREMFDEAPRSVD